MIEVSVEDGGIDPDDGRTVEAASGQPIQFVVTSDAADGLHVHSDPEEEFEIEPGFDRGALEPFTIATPGMHTVESHGLGLVLVKLQVD